MKHHLFCLLTILICLPLAAADGPWLTDIEAAKAAASEADKDLLLFFTGSDWCPPCQHLKKNILSKDAFISAATKHFVLVELDFPRHRQLPAEHRQRNDAAREHFEINAYPTLLLADAQGLPYARAGFSQEGAEVYTARLIEQRALRAQRDDALQMAAEIEGAEQGRALAAVLNVLKGRNLSLRPYASQVKAVIASDPGGDAEYAKPFRDEVVMWDMQEALNSAVRSFHASGEMPDFADLIERFGHVTQAHQQILAAQAGVAMHGGDRPRAIELLKQSHALDPDSETGQQLGRILQQLGN